MIKKQFKILDDLISNSIGSELNSLLINKLRKSFFIPSVPIKSLLLAYLIDRFHTNLILFTSDFNSQQTFINDLEFFSDNIQSFGLFDSIKFNQNLYNEIEPLGFLLQKIDNFINNSRSVLISPVDMLHIQFPQKQDLQNNIINLKINQQLNYDEFIKQLLLKGYQKTEYVAVEGEIAIRGNLIDIFPIGSINPYRIEVWGNNIESIREFDSISQRSIKQINEISFLSNVFEPSNITNPSSFDKFFDSNTIIVVDGIINEEQNYINTAFNDFPIIYLNTLFNHDFSILVNEQVNFKHPLRDFAQIISDFVTYGTNIFVCADNNKSIERLKYLFSKYLEDNFDDNTLYNYINKIKWLDKTPISGFYTKDFKIAILTEHQIFDKIPKIRSKSSNSKTGLTLKELDSLQIGDYVVHEDKGIGQFDGFQTIKIGDSFHDCLRLKYRDDDVLYLQMDSLNKITKYSNSDNISPKLDKLGSSDWDKRKERVKKRIKDISRELIKLYAIRKNTQGISFSPDTIWQKEFEASFIFQDTPDQIKATSEIKADMENSAPMDRLICGDVGFGKTEIAIRAAFKVVSDAKQVAVLVPTTILAQQHYNSFKDRMQNYPINVALLSRFRNNKEIKDILDKVEHGFVDILIGTHRILSKDVVFKDLGLLIIDEEHRFGVAAKEKLRQQRQNVDTLTLTATPIPRTLNFSLLGVRDISLIQTPPPNRLPIYTEIIYWDDKILYNILNKELQRKGQIYFISDKIHDLIHLEEKIKRILPNSRTIIAHGQMKPKELETIMEKFIAKEYDILISTKIIESGLDIPNANTIIINNATNFGLAELYQLRGRVGRSATQAYCFLIIPQEKISEKSIRRLQALEEFTELGSGLKLAMKDMEMRGVGNLFGAEQSGFIDDIGYELYTKILEEAVSEIKEQEYSQLFPQTGIKSYNYLKNNDLIIEYYKDSYINKDYVTSEIERYTLYRRMYNINSFENIKDFEEELKDRFGNIPEETKNLLFILKIRLLAMNTGIKKVIIHKESLILELPLDNSEYYQNVFPILLDYLETISHHYELLQTKSSLKLKINISNSSDIIEFLWKYKKNIDIITSE